MFLAHNNSPVWPPYSGPHLQFILRATATSLLKYKSDQLAVLERFYQCLSVACWKILKPFITSVPCDLAGAYLPTFLLLLAFLLSVTASLEALITLNPMLFFGHYVSSQPWGLDVITPFPFVCLAVSHPSLRLLCQATLTSLVWFLSPISIFSEALTGTSAYRSVPAQCRCSGNIYQMNKFEMKSRRNDGKGAG